MDIKSGYWQIEVDERNRERAAFATPDRLYQLKGMRFGLCTAPATFQRVIETVVARLKWQNCLVHLDDVVVLSGDFDDHLRGLRAVLQAIRSAGLTLKPAKWLDELKFLGHVGSNEDVRPNPETTGAVVVLPAPTDKKTLR